MLTGEKPPCDQRSVRVWIAIVVLAAGISGAFFYHLGQYMLYSTTRNTDALIVSQSPFSEQCYTASPYSHTLIRSTDCSRGIGRAKGQNW